MTLALDNTPATAPSSAPEELGYFRLSRLTPGWWRPLASLGLFAATYLILFAGLVLTWVLIPGLGSSMMDVENLDLSDPANAAFMGLMLALFIPAARLTARWLGRRGTVDSVTGRFRWSLFARASVLMVVPVLVPLGVMWALNPVTPAVSERTLGLLAVALLIIPLQAAGEEYLFRGVLMQAVGHWLKAPLWGLLLSLPLFVWGHDYDAWGLASVGVFAAVATWLTWRTGGLEAAVALHVVNNTAAFVLAAFGVGDLNATSVTWVDSALASVIPVAFALIFAWWWRRNNGDARYARTMTLAR